MLVATRARKLGRRDSARGGNRRVGSASWRVWWMWGTDCMRWSRWRIKETAFGKRTVDMGGVMGAV